jgi:hypothetical protein
MGAVRFPRTLPQLPCPAVDNAAPQQENEMPKGQERSNREKKKPKKQPAPVAPRGPGLPREPWKK